MRSLRTMLLIGIFSCLMLGSLIPVSFAAEIMGDETVTVPQSMIIQDNLIVAGGEVDVAGTVNGDLIVAGGRVTVSGVVNGDVLVAGGEVDLESTSTVQSDVKVAGGQVELSGNVGETVTLYAGESQIRGKIGKDLHVSGGRVTILGQVLGNVKIEAGEIRLGDGAHIAGDLSYVGTANFSQSDEARVDGRVSKFTSQVPVAAGREQRMIFGFIPEGKLKMKFFSLVSALIVGWILITITGNGIQRVSNTFGKKFWPSLGLGALVFFLFLPAFLLVCITIIGIPLAFLSLLAYLILLYISMLVGSYVIGGWVLKIDFSKPIDRSKMLTALLVGLAIFQVLMLIPFVSIFVRLIMVLTGLGALLITRKNLFQEAKAKGLM